MEFYRYVNHTGNTTIYLEIYYLHKETPKGYWISPHLKWNESDIHWLGDKLRWVSKTSTKRFAYPTKSEALNSFIARKKRQIKIIESQLGYAKRALKEALSYELRPDSSHEGQGDAERDA